MSKFKAVLHLIGAVFLTLALIFGWEMIGSEYIVLEFMPNVPLLSLRLGFAIAIAYLAVMGARGLVQRPEADA